MVLLSLCVLAILGYAASYDFEDPLFNQLLTSHLQEIAEDSEYVGGARHRRQIDDNDDDDSEEIHKHHKHRHHKHHHHHNKHHHKHHHHKHHHDDQNHHDHDYNSHYSERNCKKDHYSQCCDVNIMRHHRYQYEEIKQECFLQVYGQAADRYSVTPNAFKCQDPKKRMNDMTCFAQCLAFKLHLVDFDGDLIEPQFIAFVKDHVKQEWLQPHIDEIVVTCMNAAENATEAFRGDKFGCNPASVKMGHCLLSQLQMYCPEERIENPERCEKFRSMINPKSVKEVSDNQIE